VAARRRAGVAIADEHNSPLGAKVGFHSGERDDGAHQVRRGKTVATWW
jgi:hypothetical protein